jgi:hypothetical protein
MHAQQFCLKITVQPRMLLSCEVLLGPPRQHKQGPWLSTKPGLCSSAEGHTHQDDDAEG